MKLKFLPLALAALSSLSVLADPVSLSNAGFESGWTGYAGQGSDGYGVTFTYQPTGPAMTGWAFGGSTGVAGSYSQLTAYEGSRFAFLQNATGALSQDFSLAADARVDLHFAMALRASYNIGQQVGVSIDGQQVALLDADSTAWQLESLDLGLLQAGLHTLAFQGMSGTSGDTTAFIDAVQLNAAAAVPEPASLALVLGALGLLGASARRKKTNG